MDYKEIEFRITLRSCHCKVCDKLIKKDSEKMIVFKTIRGHMDTTHICLECIKRINDIIKIEEEILL